MSLKVLMFGWEFPPYNSGGLGTACQGLTKALSAANVKVSFVLPKKVPLANSAAQIHFAEVDGCEVAAVNSLLRPYLTSEIYDKLRDQSGGLYGSTLFEEVLSYGAKAGEIAAAIPHDVIHAHDWLSFPAGLAAKKESGKPLVVHVHATEYDRTGGANINPDVYKIEQEGMSGADKVIAVSERTKKMLTERYKIEADKVAVVYNGVEKSAVPALMPKLRAIKQRGDKIILFVGRVTLQKGPDYFLELAARMLAVRRDVYFIIAGSGDMERQMINEAAWRGIGDRVIFAGFVRGHELSGLYQLADIYVLPSVSEPFGIAPLEALSFGTPVLVSKQSGVAEVLHHALKADFWDVDEMANQLLSALEYPALSKSLVANGRPEVDRLTWSEAAKRCVQIYSQLIANPISA